MSSLAGKRRWTPKKRKFGNVPTDVGGIRFDSKGEAARWQDLKLLEMGKAITDLKRQVSFRLDVNGFHICRMIVDFVYEEKGVLVAEEFKSVATRTPEYKLKAKLFQALYPDVSFKEVMNCNRSLRSKV